MIPFSRLPLAAARLSRPLICRAAFASIPTNTRPPSSPASPSAEPTPTSSVSTPPLPSSRLDASLPRLRSLAARTGVPLPSLALSFLVLHELTALVPLLALFLAFQALGAGAGIVAWIASLSDATHEQSRRGRWDWRALVAGWYEEGQKRVERVGRRYGILGYDRASQTDESARGDAEGMSPSRAAEKVADAIAAYVVVKVIPFRMRRRWLIGQALLPLRIGVSIGAAPVFARFALEPMRRIAGRMRKRGPG